MVVVKAKNWRDDARCFRFLVLCFVRGGQEPEWIQELCGEGHQHGPVARLPLHGETTPPLPTGEPSQLTRLSALRPFCCVSTSSKQICTFIYYFPSWFSWSLTAIVCINDWRPGRECFTAVFKMSASPWRPGGLLKRENAPGRVLSTALSRADERSFLDTRLRR